MGVMFKEGRVNRLPIQIAVIVPSTREGDKRIGETAFKKRIKKTKRFMDSLWGGDTSIKGTGGYLSQSGDLITEDVVKVESSTTEQEFQKKKSKFKDFIVKKKNSWKQETMAYEYEGTTYIYPERDYISDQPRR